MIYYYMLTFGILSVLLSYRRVKSGDLVTKARAISGVFFGGLMILISLIEILFNR